MKANHILFKKVKKKVKKTMNIYENTKTTETKTTNIGKTYITIQTRSFKADGINI